MPLPVVTAIIPVYNREWCIARAVESVLAQDYRPLELIVVDDGSTDGTAQILAEMVARHNGSNEKHAIAFRVLSPNHGGVSAARNVGIRAARGEWIALLDSDDAWAPEKVSRQMAYHAARPETLISQTGEVWIRNGRRVNPPQRLQKREGDLFARCLDHCAVSPSAVFMARQLFDEVGLFDETFLACEDYEMWLRIAARHEIGLLDEPLLTKYGGHADQLSATSGPLDRLRIRAIVKLIENVSLTDGQRADAMQALTTKCAIYGAGCRKRGRDDEANEILALPEGFG